MNHDICNRSLRRCRRDGALPRALVLALAGLALALLSLAHPGTAEAKAQRDTRYHYDQVFPTAVRLLRVDAGYKVQERDAEAGYILFEATEEGKTFRGSLELVKLTTESGEKRVRIVVKLEDRPTYVELGLLDRLERKLREEYGAPPKSEPAPKSDKSDKSE